MLRINSMNTYYGNIHALKGIDFEVNDGELVTLIGSNGAGKSTTLLTIAGVLKAASGSRIEFDGQDLTRMSPPQIVKLGVTLSPEGREVFPELSVEDNLKLGAYCRKDAKEIQNSFEYVYDLFPRLLERKKQQAGTLSGGEQQMLAIGRALMNKPKLLMLDEPSMGLAPNLVLEIFRLIKEIHKQGTTILLVEQNANMALRIADRCYVLEVGTVKFSGDAKEMQNNDEVRKAYLGSK
ncbi:MAG: ABC transporter ATP-binding protein [Lachnospiraceae bacterium]|nr:ABC transporter ATP-binding protein [Lachnospiraceae bacterium]